MDTVHADPLDNIKERPITRHEVENLVAQRDGHKADLDAEKEKHAATRAEHDKHVSELMADHKATLDSRVDGHRSYVETIKVEYQRVIADLQAKLDNAQADIDALGGTEMAKRLRAEQECAALENRIEEDTKRLAELGAVCKVGE